ncbi:phage tail tip lysozyme [Candidatus Saccharibacteria bacterium]|nr:phage tail tip lysozyme [Candidatus Saccharibacteria bacterium]
MKRAIAFIVVLGLVIGLTANTAMAMSEAQFRRTNHYDIRWYQVDTGQSAPDGSSGGGICIPTGGDGASPGGEITLPEVLERKLGGGRSRENFFLIYNYLTNIASFTGNGGRPLNPLQAAAMMGNLIQESGLNPELVNSSSGASGLVQWMDGRLATLNAKPGGWRDINNQLEFLVEELNGGDSIWWSRGANFWNLDYIPFTGSINYGADPFWNQDLPQNIEEAIYLIVRHYARALVGTRSGGAWTATPNDWNGNNDEAKRNLQGWPLPLVYAVATLQTMSDVNLAIDCEDDFWDPDIAVDGMIFPMGGATKSNLLTTPNIQAAGWTGYSALSQPPGFGHHDRNGVYQGGQAAVDLGLLMFNQKTQNDQFCRDHGMDVLYCYSIGAPVVAISDGYIIRYNTYSNGTPADWVSRCGQLTFSTTLNGQPVTYWIGHIWWEGDTYVASTDNLIRAGQKIGTVGPPQCAQGTQAHLHQDITPRQAFNTIIRSLYEALPD